MVYFLKVTLLNIIMYRKKCKDDFPAFPEIIRDAPAYFHLIYKKRTTHF